MPLIIPATHKELIDGPVLVTMATIMPDGQPQLTLVWCNSDDTHVLVNSARGRQKERNIAHDPRVAILAADPVNSDRYLEIRGIVEEITEDGAVDHIEQLARLYTGGPGFYGHVVPAQVRKEQTRIIYRIRPTIVRLEGP